MPLREFQDSDGRTWTAWDTYPGIGDPSHPSALSKLLAKTPGVEGEQGILVRKGHEDGWLTFTCGKERRRLMPVPGQWETAELEILRSYLHRSHDVPRVR